MAIEQSMSTNMSPSPKAWSAIFDQHTAVLKGWGNESLTGLVEVTRPGDISWVPQTIGWYVIVLLIVLWVFYQVTKTLLQYQENRYRRVALKNLDNLHAVDDGLKKMPSLLKETAIFAFPRTEVASLSGDGWERWLDETCVDCGFSTTLQHQLMRIAYSNVSDVENQTKEGIYLAIRLWIRNHERKVC